MRYLLSLLLVIPCIILGYPIVAILLLTPWDGRTTWFGNAKHGKGALPGHWHEFLWLAWSNPVNNLLSITLAVPYAGNVVTGDPGISDATHGGYYNISMGKAWEVYIITPYGKRCIRLRAGWKINGKQPGDLCEMVLTFNPMKPYLGD